MGNYRFILSGGGTGGHIYPAIAIANELKNRFPDAQFLFVGAKDKMEMEKVPQAGYEIRGLWISGLQRKLSFKNLMFPIKLISSLIKARSIILDFKPHMAIGTGGFASGPVLQMAARKRIPYLLQEQNSYAGITNKLLAKKASKICVAYDGMEAFFPKDKIVKTGNPVRANLSGNAALKTDAQAFFGLDQTRKTVLVLGGSLGARRINTLIEANLDFLAENQLQLIWQCGKLYYEDYKKYESDRVKVKDFLNRMDQAYAAADIIVSRAGAGSVSELCIVGKPVIFIPSPNVAEDHQTKNALSIAAEKGAVMIREKELDTRFQSVLKEIANSNDKIKELSVNITKLAKPYATIHIVDEIEKLLSITK